MMYEQSLEIKIITSLCGERESSFALATCKGVAQRSHTCTNFAERKNFVCVYGEGQGQGVRDLDDLYRSNSAHKTKKINAGFWVP